MKSFSAILLFVLLSAHIFAQPIPCEEPPAMTSFCADACIICDIDGFTGRHESNVVGEAPPGFCTFIVHNAQWIAFIAGSTNLVVSMSVSNCDLGIGLEFALYKSDCQTHELISNCFGGVTVPIGVGQTGTISNTEPLVIGEYYYLVMDGAAGDNCDWSFNVIEGSTAVDPLENSGTIQGDFDVCPGISSTYAVNNLAGATTYDWTLDGVELMGDSSITELDWTIDGTYQLCVTASNACDAALPSCQNIIVSSLPPTLINAFICEGDTYSLNDTIALTTGGDFEYHFLNVEGCDSTVLVSLEVIGASFTNLAFFICDGDSVYIGGNPYYETGLFTEMLSNYQGCDSLVNLDLDVIICEIDGESSAEPVVCFGESSGEINFYIENGTPPFDYTWQNLLGSLTGSGSITALNEIQTISNLPEASYLIYVTDNFGNDVVLIQAVSQPPILANDWAISSFGNYNVPCFDSEVGNLEIIAIGGVAPYTYEWSNGEQSAQLTDIGAGNYIVTITDDYGCSLVAENILLEPSSLSFEVDFRNPTCEGFESGFIEILSASGGTSPYQYSYGGSGFTENTSMQGLPEGAYTVTMQDAEGCTNDTTGTMIAPIIPILELGEDLEINLGESTSLNLTSNILLDSLIWFSKEGLSCYDCPNPVAFPFVTTNYIAAVTSIDNCTSLDSITVKVIERRRVYIPNAFSPDFDGTNDYLIVHAGVEVSRIVSFNIFSRWGEHVFGQDNFPPNDRNYAWDGRFKAKDVATGVYVWYAEVEYLDGLKQRMEGSLMLIR